MGSRENKENDLGGGLACGESDGGYTADSWIPLTDGITSLVRGGFYIPS